MPRDIGASIGVKRHARPASPVSRPRFCSISGVCRWTPPTPYADGRAHHLGAEQVRLERLARAGRAGDGDDDDVGGVDEPGRDGRRQRRASTAVG